MRPYIPWGESSRGILQRHQAAEAPWFVSLFIGCSAEKGLIYLSRSVNFFGKGMLRVLAFASRNAENVNLGRPLPWPSSSCLLKLDSLHRF